MFVFLIFSIYLVRVLKQPSRNFFLQVFLGMISAAKKSWFFREGIIVCNMVLKTPVEECIFYQDFSFALNLTKNISSLLSMLLSTLLIFLQ